MLKLSKKLTLLFSWVPGEIVTERLCLASALWWVLQLAPSAHLFAHNSNFRGLERVGGEQGWQMVMAGLLILQAAGVWRNLRVLRVAALLLFGVIWMMIAGLFYAGNPAPLPFLPLGPAWWTLNTGVGVYVALGTCCIVFGLHLAGCAFLDFLMSRTGRG